VAAGIPADLRPGEHLTELTVGGMRKNGAARLAFARNADGTFGFSYSIEIKGHGGRSGPMHGAHKTVEGAVGAALDFTRIALSGIANNASASPAHHAAAKAGAAWCAARLAEWGLDTPIGDGVEAERGADA
jgi:hypothetical protein